MKSYYSFDQLRLVGKAWQIRYQLKQLTRKEKEAHQSLRTFLASRQFHSTNNMKRVRQLRNGRMKREATNIVRVK